MRIVIQDVITGGDPIALTAALTSEHSQSSFGQPVMVIDEWGGQLMDHHNWILGGGRVTDATDEERELFRRWHALIDELIGVEAP